MESFAQVSSTGNLFIANGVDRVLVWTGTDTVAFPAGVDAPGTALTLAGSGVGGITGTYYGWIRWGDARGNFSNLSPISNPATVNAVGQINYSNIPVPDVGTVTIRQIIRNTNGSVGAVDQTTGVTTSIGYVDIEDSNVTATTATSTRLDADLSTQESVDIDAASAENGVPPSYKPFLIWHQNRMYLAGIEPYREGSAAVTFGSATVQGYGTRWKETFVGRLFYTPGVAANYLISAVDETNQTLTLSTVFSSATNDWAEYSIRPVAEEANAFQWCCDDQTQALTKRGWKKHHELLEDDELLTISPTTRQIEWGQMVALNVFDHDGEMNHWANTKFDAMTTDGHRWLADGCGIMGGHWSLRVGAGRYHFPTSSEVTGTFNRRLITGGGVPVRQWPRHSDQFASLLGWYITEGTRMHGRGQSGTKISQSEAAHPQHVKTIRSLADHYRKKGCTVSEYATEGGVTAIAPGSRGAKSFYFGKGIGNLLRQCVPDKQKTLTPELLCSLDGPQLQLLYEAMMSGDGHQRQRGNKSASVFTQKNASTLDAFQMLCAMIGKRSRLRVNEKRGLGHIGVYNTGFTSTSELKQSRVPYKGKVWCPTTKNGTWMARRNGVTYWTGNSGPNAPEAWNPSDVLVLPEDGDKVTGAFNYGSYLYFLKSRTMYRFITRSDPAADGRIFLACKRGCVNNRCWVIIDETCFLLDTGGAYAYKGDDQGDPISTPIQDMFNNVPGGTGPKINWAASRYFSACHSPNEEVVRWFVALAGDYVPRHALCYAYKLQKWWTEPLPFRAGASILGKIGGRVGTVQEPVEQYYVGSTGGRVLAPNGSLDGSGEDGTIRGTATSAGWLSLTDVNARFATGAVNSPVAITGGKGRGQVRYVTAQTSSRLTLNTPWRVKPDTTSTYCVGGIAFAYSSQRLRWAVGEQNMARGIELEWHPNKVPNKVRVGLAPDFSDPVKMAWVIDQGFRDFVTATPGAMGQDLDLTDPNGYQLIQQNSGREGTTPGSMGRTARLVLSGVTNEEQVAIGTVLVTGATG